jgi:hypothetical protein
MKRIAAPATQKPELVTIWDGNCHATHRGLLDDFRGLTGEDSAMFEKRLPEDIPPSPRYSPRKPRTCSMTQRVLDIITAAGVEGITKAELYADTPEISDAVMGKIFSKLVNSGRIHTLYDRRYLRANRYWAMQFAPEER